MLKVLLLLPLLALVSAGEAAPVPTELATYLNRAEPGSGWQLKAKDTFDDCDYWHLRLNSQTWQEIPWEHDLVIFSPRGVAPSDKMVLLNEGGKFSPDRLPYGATLATTMRASVAILLVVPNQPLLGGKYEDDLIAETFVRYLETEDPTWPLLFPMVKSVVRAMDAIEEFTAAEWKTPADRFLITGASKRGWTAWLTAAHDDRIMALAPMVIDVLDFPAQLDLQLDRFGEPSKQIDPYTKRGLVPLGDTPAAKRLWAMVDPFTYRAKYQMPTMVILGNNDPYWSTDALNVYWDGIPGEKYISYTPNAGHDLRETNPEGARQKVPLKALNNLAAFVRSQFHGIPMPGISWEHDDTADGNFRLEITTNKQPAEARLWIASSPNKDLRGARWESRPIEVAGGRPLVATVERPGEGYLAYYADLGFKIEEIPLWLCTQVRFVGAE